MRVFVLMVALFIGMMGLSMTACGLVFTITSLPKQGEWPMLMIALPATLFGLGTFWLARKIWKSQMRPPPDAP